MFFCSWPVGNVETRLQIFHHSGIAVIVMLVTLQLSTCKSTRIFLGCNIRAEYISEFVRHKIDYSNDVYTFARNFMLIG